jgi:excisionase family DNA binding protein
MTKKLMTIAEAARFLGVDRKTVARALDAGHLPAVVLHRRRLVPYTAVISLLGETP